MDIRVPRRRSAQRALSVTACLILFASDICAQPVQTRRLSLDDAIDRALSAGDEIAIAQTSIASAEGSQAIAASGYLPQISASLSYNRTLLSQYSGLADNAGSDTTSGDSSGGGLSGLFENLPFGQKNQWTIGVTLSQVIFAGGRLAAASDASAAQRRLADIELTTARAQLVLNVVESYFDAILADQMVSIVDSSFAQSGVVFRQTELAFKLGQKSEFEMLRSRVVRDNQIPQQITRRAERASAHDRLKQLLNIPLNDSLVLTSGVAESYARFTTAPDTAADARAAVLQAGEGVALSRAQLAIAESERWPLIALVSRFAPVAYPKNVFPAPDDFGIDWTVGFSISMPLFTGGRIGGSEAIARASIDAAEARARQAREAAAGDARAALRELAQAEAMLEATAGTVEEAQRVNKIAAIRFREGIATQIDVTDARLLLEQSLANRARAQRNVHVARARLALLKDLPLGGGRQQSAPIQQAAGSNPTQSQGSAVTGASQQSMQGSTQNFQGSSGQ